MNIHKPYGKRTEINTAISCDQGMTEQHHQQECDVNYILKKYIKTGNITHTKKHEPQYGDSTSLDLHEALNIVTNANSMFMELPAQTRAKFENDPGQFLDYVQDESNLDEMYELGLAYKPNPLKNEPEAPTAPKLEATPSETSQD